MNLWIQLFHNSMIWKLVRPKLTSPYKFQEAVFNCCQCFFFNFRVSAIQSALPASQLRNQKSCYFALATSWHKIIDWGHRRRLFKENILNMCHCRSGYRKTGLSPFWQKEPNRKNGPFSAKEPKFQTFFLILRFGSSRKTNKQRQSTWIQDVSFVRYFRWTIFLK